MNGKKSKEYVNSSNLRRHKDYHITDKGLKRIENFKDEWKEIISIYRFITKEDDENE